MTDPVPTANPGNGLRRGLLTGLGLALLTLAVYAPVRHHAFTNFDDPNYLTANPYVQAGLTRSGLAWAFFSLHGENSYWHPVTWVSHMVDCQLFGMNPGPHHLVNLGIHVLNTLLLLLALQRLTGARWRSVIVAGLFALHPLQVEGVAWAAERKNVLSTTFWLLTLLAYVRYARAPGVTRYMVMVVCFAVGLMCKPALVTLPVVLLLLDYWPLGRMTECGVRSAECGLDEADSQRLCRKEQFRTMLRLVLEKVPLLLLALVAGLMTIVAARELGADLSARVPWQWRLENAFVSYVRYLGKAFWPADLVVFYPYPGAWPVWAFVGSALFLWAVSGWVIWQRRRAPYLFTGWFWFLVVLLPMIGIIQAGSQAMADRFAYVPSMGLFIMAVWGIAGWAERRLFAVSAVAALLALGLCLVLTSRQVSTWQNSITLFEHALRVDSNNACAHYSLGSELADQGRTQEAMREWEISLEIEPWWANTHGKIGSVLCQQGNYPGAIARYRRALEIDPAQHEVLNNLAWLLATCPDASLRDGPEAVRLALKACEVTRSRKTIMVGTLAAAYAEAGQYPEATEAAQKACELAAARGESSLLARNRELMELYRAGKPYHESGGPARP
jgi:protein O-mannosyl-transferase